MRPYYGESSVTKSESETRIDALSAQVDDLRREMKQYTNAAISSTTKSTLGVIAEVLNPKFADVEASRNKAIDKRLGSVRDDVEAMRVISDRELEVATETLHAAGFSFQYAGGEE